MEGRESKQTHIHTQTLVEISNTSQFVDADVVVVTVASFQIFSTKNLASPLLSALFCRTPRAAFAPNARVQKQQVVVVDAASAAAVVSNALRIQV